jgi:hypothetical protein
MLQVEAEFEFNELELDWFTLLLTWYSKILLTSIMAKTSSWALFESSEDDDNNDDEDELVDKDDVDDDDDDDNDDVDEQDDVNWTKGAVVDEDDAGKSFRPE